jgi:hypothetical protein
VVLFGLPGSAGLSLDPCMRPQITGQKPNRVPEI